MSASNPLHVPPLRLGIVPYLNVRPMVYGLQESFPQLQLAFAVPRELDSMLAQQRIDLGIVPVFSAFAAEGRAVYSAPVIASDGPVYSVLIVSNQPIESLRRIRRDPHSLTSNALAAVLLRNYWQSDAELCDGDDGDCEMGDDEGRVIIGDPAIRARPQWRHLYDLGEAWRQWTGLPFVFAAWIGPNRQRTEQFKEALEQIVRENFERLAEVAASYTILEDIPLEERVDYLKNYLSFAFGPRERQAIERFHAECVKLNLAQPGTLHFAETRTDTD